MSLLLCVLATRSEFSFVKNSCRLPLCEQTPFFSKLSLLTNEIVPSIKPSRVSSEWFGDWRACVLYTNHHYMRPTRRSCVHNPFKHLTPTKWNTRMQSYVLTVNDICEYASCADVFVSITLLTHTVRWTSFDRLAAFFTSFKWIELGNGRPLKDQWRNSFQSIESIMNHMKYLIILVHVSLRLIVR